MKIYVTGSADRLTEFREIIAESLPVTYVEYSNAEQKDTALATNDFNLIVDLNLDEYPERINIYSLMKNKIVVGCAVKKTLKDIASFSAENVQCYLTGFNGLPTFINRNKKEVSFLNAETKQHFALIAETLNWEWLEVKDTAGMVTPRVIMMIINEAFFTLEEKTALKQDIDTGMKLGTAYPIGPLEWAEKIGINNVFETLNAIKQQSNDSRYTISPLLESVYRNSNISIKPSI